MEKKEKERKDWSMEYSVFGLQKSQIVPKDCTVHWIPKQEFVFRKLSSMSLSFRESW